MADLVEIADELYALPLAEFTPTRDARAKALKAEDADLAAAVKALRKPTLAAWVVNAFVRAESEQVQQLLDVGASLRAAQHAMSAEELRALTKQRRQLTAALTTRARGLASRSGIKVTSAVADQVEATLTAAIVDEQAGQALRSGLLVAPLATTGLGDLDVAAVLATPQALGFAASATESPSAPALRVVPDPDAAAKARAAAEEAVAEAEEQHQAAAAEHEDLQARSLQLQAEIEELRRQIGDLESDAEDLDEALAEAEEARDEAAADLERARQALARL